jgi:hypothetical protein
MSSETVAALRALSRRSLPPDDDDYVESSGGDEVWL